MFAWSQSISSQVFGSYKGDNGAFVIEGLGRHQFSQVINDTYICTSDGWSLLVMMH